MKYLLSILLVLGAFTIMMAIMALTQVTPRKKSLLAVVRWMIFGESIFAGCYSGYLIGGIVGVFIIQASAYVVGWTTIILYARVDPYRFVEWFFD